MKESKTSKLTVSQRRTARRLAIWNGGLWAIGNGLASTTLIVYLARELCAEKLGVGIGLIVASPQIVGLLRIGAPAMLNRLGNGKRFCIGNFFIAAMLLLVLPWVCAPGRLPSPSLSLGMLIVLWCFYHLFQYVGMVGLWSWLAEVATEPVRGRFLGRRERWMVAGTAVSAVDAGLFVWGFAEIWPDLPRWSPYGIAAVLGAGFMAAALVPLGRMPSFYRKSNVPWHSLSSLVRPFRDARFLRLLWFGCWFSFFNGITQSAQDYYPMQVLGVSLLLSQTLKTGMRLGQWGISPRLGALADRLGNRPVMIVCQLMVAGGLLFFAAASPERWEWLLGAWILWIAYAGLNICLPNLTLKLAPPAENASYVAAFDGIRGLCFAASTIVGGILVDRSSTGDLGLWGMGGSFFVGLFVLGWVFRSIGVVWLFWVIEPARNEPS